MTNEVLTLWGNTMKSLMRLQGVSQIQLAEKVEVRPASVCRWLKGTNAPSDAHKVAIAEALNSEVQAIFPLVRGMGR